MFTVFKGLNKFLIILLLEILLLIGLSLIINNNVNANNTHVYMTNTRNARISNKYRPIYYKPIKRKRKHTEIINGIIAALNLSFTLGNIFYVIKRNKRLDNRDTRRYKRNQEDIKHTNTVKAIKEYENRTTKFSNQLEKTNKKDSKKDRENKIDLLIYLGRWSELYITTGHIDKHLLTNCIGDDFTKIYNAITNNLNKKKNEQINKSIKNIQKSDIININRR